jgi:O-methyltransferase
MITRFKNLLKNILPDSLVKKIGEIHYKLSLLTRYELVLGPLTYNQDGLATRHNCDFLNDTLFSQSYRLGRDTGSWGGTEVHWRAFVLCWAANKAKNMEGDFVECGVNKGGFSLMVMNYVDFRNLAKTFYLLDTYCGLSEDYITEEERKRGARGGIYSECYEQVKETFKKYDNMEIIRGTVPDTLPMVKSKKIAYLSIDMNCVIPEIAAAEYFWDKLVSGAIVILDDYGYAGHILQKLAFDEFAQKKQVQILQLPTGQGLIFKP